ncbi:hypothetical protein ACH4S8_37755 [Streptomyces sp. NPDC021080]|uniref:hypothetical protein n=1 Tax=Streptomyces sp. NPDC021080 TaxID=3365110 RepID=UPI0037A31327
MKLDLGWSTERKWSKALQDLVLPNRPLTLELVLEAYVTQKRGNRLILKRDPLVASPNGPSGMWVTAKGVKGDPVGVDVVWVHPLATGVLKRRIVAHEWGHMVNGDQPDPVELREVMRLLQSTATHTPSSWAESMLCERTDFDDPREQRAEEFSYWAEDWLTRIAPLGSGLADSMRACLDTRSESR